MIHHETLRAALKDAIDSGAKWDESTDVPQAARAKLLEAWSMDADADDIGDALIGGDFDTDDMQTLLLFAMGRPMHHAQTALLNRFWAGLYRVIDREIERAREELRAEDKAERRYAAETFGAWGALYSGGEV